MAKKKQQQNSRELTTPTSSAHTGPPPAIPISFPPFTAATTTIIKDASAAAVLFTFSFYILGYVILHGFLSRFEIRLPSGNAFDCISAALCYVLFISAIGLPAWLLFHALWKRQNDPSYGGAFLLFIVFLWNAVMSSFISLVFHTPLIGPQRSSGTYTLLIVVGLHIILLLLLRLLKKAPAVSAFLSGWVWFYVYLTLDQFIVFVRQPGVDGAFVTEAVLLYATITNLPTYLVNNPIDQLRRTEVKIMLGLFAICLVLSNANRFGRKQYALLPSTVGGGKPSTVFLKTILANGAHPERLDIPIVDGYIGPVLLIYKTESEIAVISETDIETKPHAAVQISRSLVEAIVTTPAPIAKSKEESAPKSPAPTPLKASTSKQEEKSAEGKSNSPVNTESPNVEPKPVPKGSDSVPLPKAK